MGTLNHEKSVLTSIVTAFALLTVAFWATPTITVPKDGVHQGGTPCRRQRSKTQEYGFE